MDGDSGRGRASAADLCAALLLVLASGGLLAWQALSMPADVAQFTKYQVAALQLASGSQAAERIADYSPLYLAVHRAALALFADPTRGVLLLQSLSIGLAAALLFLAVRRHAGLAVAAACAAALVLERNVAVHAFICEPEALLLLFIAAWLYFAGRTGTGAALGAGAALGLALLTRPGLIALALFTPLLFAVRGGDRREGLSATGAFLLPVALALALLCVRGHGATGSWSPAVMNPGVVFFDGNNPYAHGYGANYPPVVRDVAAASPGESDFEHAAYRRLARLDAGPGLGVGEVNRFWAGKALAFLGDEPGEALRRFARKALFAIHPYPWYDFQGASDADNALRRRGIPATPGALLSALALVGAVLGCRRWRECFPAFALGAAQAAVMLATYASARQRIALLPAVCLFAGVAAARLAAGGRGARAAGVAVLVLAGLLWRETDMMREHRRIHDRAAAGDAPTPGGGLRATADRAARFEEALRHFNGGRIEEAEPLFAALNREGYSSLRGEPAYFLGRIAAMSGRIEEATAMMREALRRAPGHPVVLAQLAVLTGEPGHAARLHRYLDASDARYELARAALLNGRADEAAPLLRRLVADLPEHSAAAEMLAKALSAGT